MPQLNPLPKNICMVETKTYIYGAPKSGRVTGHWQEEEEWPPRAAAASHSPTLPLLAQRLFNVLTRIKVVKHDSKGWGGQVILILTHVVHYLRRWCMLG